MKNHTHSATVRRIYLCILFGLLLPAIGCDKDAKSEDELTESREWLTRKATPESEFAPKGIESVIDSVVVALNNNEQQEGMKIVFMPKVQDAFFQDAVLGANRAFGELAVLGTIAAPEAGTKNAEEQQLAIFENQMADGVLNFGIAPNSEAMMEQIDLAVDSGGIVVTFDTDYSNTRRHLYVGTNNVQAGKTAGATMLTQLENGPVGTNIILGHDDELWTDGYNRTHEARKVIEAAGYSVEVINTNWIDYTSNVTAIRETMEAADPPVVGCLGVFNTSYACADAVVAEGLQSQVKVVTFDAESETVQYMNEGIIQATHTQRLYYTGYLLPYVIYAIQRLGLETTKQLFAPLTVEESRIDTGLDVIYADKLAEYDSFMDTLDAL